jgi:hypothetical protein
MTVGKQVLVVALWAGVCAMACTGQTDAGQPGQANVQGRWCRIPAEWGFGRHNRDGGGGERRIDFRRRAEE